jgi:hypothetical protein
VPVDPPTAVTAHEHGLGYLAELAELLQQRADRDGLDDLYDEAGDRDAPAESDQGRAGRSR